MIPSLNEDNSGNPRKVDLYSTHVKCHQIPTLIPFMDLANHADKSLNSGSVYFDVESDSVHLQLRKPIDVGEEVFIYYGVRTNRKFLVHNGFVPEETNSEDFYELRVGTFDFLDNIRRYKSLAFRIASKRVVIMEIRIADK